MSQRKQPIFRREVYERYAAAMDAEDRSPPAPPRSSVVMWLGAIGLGLLLVFVLRREVPNRVMGTARAAGDRVVISIKATDRARVAQSKRFELNFAAGAREPRKGIQRLSIDRPELEWVGDPRADQENVEFSLRAVIEPIESAPWREPSAVQLELDPRPLYSLLPGLGWLGDRSEP